MKRIVYKKLDLEIELVENIINVIVIENTSIYSDMIQSLWEQINGNEGNIIFSVDNKEVSISKYADVIINPCDITINSKKILNKLYSEIENVISCGYMDKMVEINAKLVNIFDNVSNDTEYDVVYEPELNISGLIKLYDFHIRDEDIDIVDKLINYMRVASKILGLSVFVFVNLKMYLSNEELEGIYNFGNYEKIQIILIEGVQKNELEYENTLIITEDLCII